MECFTPFFVVLTSGIGIFAGICIGKAGTEMMRIRRKIQKEEIENLKTEIQRLKIKKSIS